MARVINKLGLWVLRAAAVLVMVLAVLVGLARLLLPEASRFADEVRAVARETSGFVVDFELLSAGMSWYGPELRLTGAEVRWPDGTLAFAADEIAVAADIYELIKSRRPVPSLIHVEGSQLDVEISADGKVLIQDRPWLDYVGNTRNTGVLTEVRVSLADVQIGFRDRKRGIDAVDANLRQLFAVLEDEEVELDLEIRPDPEFGHSLELSGLLPVQLLSDPQQLADERSWRLQLRAEDFRLDPWLKLAEIINTPLIDSEGTAEAAVEFLGRQPVAVQATADIDELVLAQPDGTIANYDEVAGSVEWRVIDDGWEATGAELRLSRGGRRWPASEFSFSYRGDIQQQNVLGGSMSFLRLDDLMPFFAAFGHDQLQQAGVRGSVAGDIWRASVELERLADKVVDYELNADFESLGYQSAEQDIDIAGLSGRVRAAGPGGTVTLATADARLGWGVLFREALPVSSLETLALWRRSDDSFRLIISDLHLVTPDGRGTASLEIFSDNKLENPQIDLTAEASMGDATQVGRYLPKTLPEKTLAWVDRAVLAGRSDHTEFRLRGPLREFPFRGDQGQFSIDIEFADASLDYASGWPAVEAASGHLVFDNESMYSTQNRLTVRGVELQNVSARIADLREAVVTIEAGATADADTMLGFLQNSPVAEKLGGVFADIGAAGETAAQISLQIPLRNMSDWQLQGSVRLSDVSAWLSGLQPRLSDITGELRVDRYFVTGDGLTGRLLDEDVAIRIEANPAADANFSHRASLGGDFPYARIREEMGLPDLGVIAGRTNLKAAAMFPALREGSRPFRLLVHSDLEGISSSLPYPLGKQADTEEIFDAEILFPARDSVDARLNLERGVRANLDFRKTGGTWALQGGLVEVGVSEALPPGTDGLVVSAVVDRLSIDEWRDAFAQNDAVADAAPAARTARRWQDLFATAELLVADLEVLGYGFRDTDLRVDFGGSEWDVELIGPWLEGRVTVPYDLHRDALIEAELARLLLIEPIDDAGADDNEDEDYTTSPTDLPGFRGTVGEFALGTMRLGQLDFDVRTIPDGLETRQMILTAPTFKADISGDWQVVDSAQRSRVHLEFNSNDLQSSLDQLGFVPLISAGRAQLVSDLLWEGGPGMAAVEASTGEATMIIRDGHINEVSSGGGRLLGLLSVASLPRRLALDFTDLTKDKLEFSKISGDFRIDFGDVWTCNLGLEGEIVDMALVGRTGRANQDFDHVAVVRPHVSNLMPVPAAFLGGPTVGVAALLVSQIFKKPLSGIGESYYTIRGPWEGSEIRKVQRSELDTTPFADCENSLPSLSPEEITAIRELVNQGQAATDVQPEPDTPQPQQPDP